MEPWALLLAYLLKAICFFTFLRSWEGSIGRSGCFPKTRRRGLLRSKTFLSHTVNSQHLGCFLFLTRARHFLPVFWGYLRETTQANTSKKKLPSSPPNKRLKPLPFEGHFLSIIGFHHFSKILCPTSPAMLQRKVSARPPWNHWKEGRTLLFLASGQGGSFGCSRV